MLGYDGIPWTELYPQLLEAELPIWIGSTFGSTDAAMLISAGMNWHLFETIDIRRQATDEIVHLATDVLRVTPRRPAQCSIRGNEQLRIPGVPMPDHGARDFITFGIFESTSIGYIYVASWSFDPADRISEQFEEAIRTLMFERDTAGLIIDYRQNTGGSMLRLTTATHCSSTRLSAPSRSTCEVTRTITSPWSLIAPSRRGDSLFQEIRAARTIGRSRS